MSDYEILKKNVADEAAKIRRKTQVSSKSNEVDQGSQLVGDHSALLDDARMAHSTTVNQRAQLLSGLQQTHGNAYVQRLLNSKGIQAKLTVNPPDDQYEKEADRVGEAVAKASSSPMQRQVEEEPIQAKRDSGQPITLLQRQPMEEEEEEVQTKRADTLQLQVEDEEEEELQTKSAATNTPGVSENMETQINSARVGGEALPDSIRSSFEPQFGRDFSNVRVHADAEADNLSQQLGAKAFTTGQDIFFRSGDYQPETDSGKQLLGHEMTHVVQQGGGSVLARKPLEAEGEDSSVTMNEAETELAEIKEKAIGSMSLADIRALIVQAARCQELGLAQAAQNVLDEASKFAMAILKRQSNAFEVSGSSLNVAKDLLDQLAIVHLLDVENNRNEMFDKLVRWAEGHMMAAIKELGSDPSKASAQGVLEKAALVQLLGGNVVPAMAAIQDWTQMEKEHNQNSSPGGGSSVKGGHTITLPMASKGRAKSSK